MNISDIAPLLSAKILQSEFADGKVSSFYTGDLLSDILGNANEGCVIITMQAHDNALAVALSLSARAIVFCNSRTPSDEMLSKAREEKIAIFETGKNQFTVSGILYNALRAEKNSVPNAK